ncbi:MAG: hypothetical protein WKF43_01560 [Acidimicrobiales bacterium]
METRGALPGSEGGEDAGLLRVSDVATVVFVVAAVASALFLEQLKLVAVVVSLTLFVLGCGAFLWALAIAVDRSRRDAIGIGGLFFLQGSAPRAIQVRLIGALAVQTVVAVATAAVHPFTSQAFVILAPLFGIGAAGLWGARHGRFGPRTDRATRRPDSAAPGGKRPSR